MEVAYRKEKKISLFKKLESCLSISRRAKCHCPNKASLWKPEVAPTGCFSVYVGAERQRFVIRAEFANHPLFRMLLEDAELEYGFASEGPLLLPCEVDLFCKILAEVDGEDRFDDRHCGIRYGGCSPFNPVRRLGKTGMAKGCSSYGMLTPPRLLKINHF